MALLWCHGDPLLDRFTEVYSAAATTGTLRIRAPQSDVQLDPRQKI